MQPRRRSAELDARAVLVARAAARTDRARAAMFPNPVTHFRGRTRPREQVEVVVDDDELLGSGTDETEWSETGPSMSEMQWDAEDRRSSCSATSPSPTRTATMGLTCGGARPRRIDEQVCYAMTPTSCRVPSYDSRDDPAPRADNHGYGLRRENAVPWLDGPAGHQQSPGWARLRGTEG